MNTEELRPLTGKELETALGGDWSWGDFASGVSWSLGLGCLAFGNPVLCGGALLVTGISYYF